MPFHQQRAAALPQARASGALAPEDIDRCAIRIVATQLRTAASIDPVVPTTELVACSRHRALAREAGACAMVLLKNEAVQGGPVLPLDPSSLMRLAVVGPLATHANLGDRR